MKLNKLIENIPILSKTGNLDVEIKGLCQDTRTFKKGDLFFAIQGRSFDSHSFIPKAISGGASAILSEKDIPIPPTFAGAVVRVQSCRDILNPIATKFFKDPSQNLFLVGVTGTNGKTTTTLMIEAVLNKGKIPTGVIGTIDNHFKSEIFTASHTTPDPITLQSLLAHWVRHEAKAATLEVSSHALEQGRVDSLSFDVGVFTNLTRDHLDFHQNMENYVSAKAKLFKNLLKLSVKKNKRAILNADDSFSRAMKPSDVPVWTYGFSGGDFHVTRLNLTFDGTDIEVKTPQGIFTGRLNIVGRHNVANALAALAVGAHAEIPLADISNALNGLKGIKGRLERVPTRSGLRIFVDYAHTDDGLVNVLSFLNNMRNETSPQSKIITIFGCGGDRDKGKRPLMMRAALDGSDFVVVTSDNPRREDPEKIIHDILTGASKSQSSKIAVDADRKRAIQLGVEKARPGDVILIAGKGHEDYQIIGDVKHPFDDVKVVKELLKS